jgi:hypothetical protein
MSSAKGYPSQTKLDRVKSEFSTVEPVREGQNALSVNAHLFMRVVGTDAAEAASTSSVIVATAHAALKGDVIRFTSGTHSGKEFKVYATATNSITLVEDLAAVVGTGDTFEILRHKYPVVNADGTLSVSTPGGGGPIQFVYDGVDTEVEQDTATPANNRGLPVTIVGASGAVTITAGSLEVHLDSANDSVAAVQSGTWNITNVSGTVSLPTGAATLAEQQSQTTALQLLDDAVATAGSAITAKGFAVIGTDGTDARVLKTDAAGELQVDVLTMPTVTVTATDLDIRNLSSVTDSVASVQSGAWDITDITGTVSLPTGASTETTLAALNAKLNSLGQKAMAASAPVVIASDQSAVPVSGTVAATQSGTWNIADISGTVSLPTGAATETTLSAINGKLNSLGAKTSANSVPVVLASDQAALPITDNGGSVTVDGTVAATQSGAWSITDISGTVSLPTGAATETTLSAINGKLNSLGQKSMANSAPVVLASDQASIPVTVSGTVTGATLSVVDLLDTPAYDTSSANINGSAGNPTQVVATLAANVKKMQIIDTTGAFIGLYTGAALSEVLQLIIGPGSDQTIEHTIASGARISLKRLDSTTAISSGIISINFLG